MFKRMKHSPGELKPMAAFFMKFLGDAGESLQPV